MTRDLWWLYALLIACILLAVVSFAGEVWEVAARWEPGENSKLS